MLLCELERFALSISNQSSSHIGNHFSQSYMTTISIHRCLLQQVVVQSDK